MKRLLSIVFLLLAWGVSAAGQTIPNMRLTDLVLKQYLGLSDAQWNAITQANQELQQWVSVKRSRIVQLQSEIEAETAKPILEPFGLGARYAEIETICRQVEDEAESVRRKNVARLTTEQAAKLQTLEDAVRLAPTAAVAQGQLLVGGATVSSPAPILVPANGPAPRTYTTRLGLSACGGVGGFTSTPVVVVTGVPAAQ